MIPPYLVFYVVPLLGWVSLGSENHFAYSLPVFAFVFVPIIDRIVGPRVKKIDSVQKSLLSQSNKHSFILYSLLPIHFLLLYYFLAGIDTELPDFVKIGRILTMGLLCGIIGINVAHELGHRSKNFEKNFSLSLLMTSLYMHFYIEHNRGHHKNVATPNDPVSARKDENIYSFLLRCIPGCMIHASKLEKERLSRINRPYWSVHNQLLKYLFLEICWLISIFSVFGIKVLLYYVVSAFIGIILLECIEYIEHYGLKRKEIKPGIFEKVSDNHSWNCDHLPGRLLLFELPLHPTHHKNSQIQYQMLESTEDSPQMPMGYPAMVLTCLIPPLWFKLINPRLSKVTLEAS